MCHSENYKRPLCFTQPRLVLGDGRTAKPKLILYREATASEENEPRILSELQAGTTYVLVDDRNVVAIHRDADVAGVEQLSRS